MNHFWNAGMMLIIFLTIVYLTKLVSGMRHLESEKEFVEEKNRMLDASLKEKEILIRETHHRMKNQLAMLGSLIKMSAEDDSEKLIKKLDSRIQTFSILYEKLTYSQDNNSKIKLNSYCKEIIDLIFQNYEVKQDSIECNISGGDFYIDAKPASLIGLIINELATNSIKYAFTGMMNELKIIDVKFSINDLALTFLYRDNGPGFTYQNIGSVEGHIGFILIDLLSKQLGGGVHHDGVHGSGFIFTFNVANIIMRVN